MFNSVFLMFNQLMFPETGEFVRNNTDFMVWLSVGNPRQGDRSDGESRSVVESEHRPGSCGCSFFNITKDIELSLV